MPVPYIFEPNTVAHSSQVNANFDYILGSVIGGIITDEAEFLRDIVFGKRLNHVLGGAHDTNSAAPSRAFTMLSWNARFKDQGGGDWKWLRINSGENSTVAKVGADGFQVATTSRTTGSLDTQLNTVFAVTATEGVDFFYFPKNWGFHTRNGNISSVEDYRMTSCWLETPVDLMTTNTVTKQKGTWVVDFRELGAGSSAKTVYLSVVGKASSSSSASCRIYMERGTRNKAYGVGLFCAINQENQAQGHVLLGRGAREGQAVIENTASFASLNIYLLGYEI